MKKPVARSTETSEKFAAACWGEINQITHNDLAMAISQAKSFALRKMEIKK